MSQPLRDTTNKTPVRMMGKIINRRLPRSNIENPQDELPSKNVVAHSRVLQIKNGSNNIPTRELRATRTSKLHQVQVQPIQRASDNRPEVKGIEREMTCADYVDDIARYILHSEKKFALEKGFLSGGNITPKMRYILVDWLVLVHLRFHLVPETLHLTVYLMDCVLSKQSVDKSELQLVGVACMLVASKFEEILAPDMTFFEFITDNSFNKKQIRKMELKVLDACNCNMNRPPSVLFLRNMSMDLPVSSKAHSLAKYFGELALQEYTVAHVLPSKVACVSVYLASVLCKDNIDVGKMRKMCDVTEPELRSLAKLMSTAILKVFAQPKLVALSQKYAIPKNRNVSEFSEEQKNRLHLFANS